MLAIPPIIEGRYRVGERIGEGGFGAVYAGLHLTMGTKVAIKVLRVAASHDPASRADQIDRFLEEGRLLTRLRHPNIVAALDLGVLPADATGLTSPYLVMEWVEGPTLHQYVAERGGPLSPPDAWQLFEPLVDALAHAHRALVVHRDLTPGNVMIVRDGAGRPIPRVIDFGVAKAFEATDAPGQGTTATATPNPYTPGYAAPEQLTQTRTGPWTDVHALGLLFVQLVTGMPPYGVTGNPRLGIIDPARPSPRARGVDVGALEPVIAKAVALRPADRFANAGEFLDAARAAMRTFGTPAWGQDGAAQGFGQGAPETGAPASKTLGRSAPPLAVSRRVVLGASLVGAAALAVGGGMLVVPRLRQRVAPPVPRPLPSASASLSGASATTLASLMGPSLDKRVVAAGYKVDYHQDAVGPSGFVSVYWMENATTWVVEVRGLNVVDTPDRTHEEAHLDAMASHLNSFRASFAISYGADSGAVALVMTRTETASPALDTIFDKVFAGVPLLVRGSTFGPKDPVLARETAVKNTPLTASHLDDLSANELASRLRHQGVEVSTVAQSTPDFGMAFFARKGLQGQAYAYKKDGKATLPGLRAQAGPQAWAIEGDAFVMVMGDASFANEAFLRKVLTGLHAEMHSVQR